MVFHQGDRPLQLNRQKWWKEGTSTQPNSARQIKSIFVKQGMEVPKGGQIAVFCSHQHWAAPPGLPPTCGCALSKGTWPRWWMGADILSVLHPQRSLLMHGCVYPDSVAPVSHLTQGTLYGLRATPTFPPPYAIPIQDYIPYLRWIKDSLEQFRFIVKDEMFDTIEI